MFKAKRTDGLHIPYKVVEIKLDGTEETYCLCDTRAKAQLIAKLLNEVAVVEVS